MTRQNQKQRIKKLEEELIDLKLKLHTDKYIHISFNWKKIGFFFLAIALGSLAYYNLKLLDWNLIKVIFSSDDVIKNYQFQSSQLINLYPIIGEYIIISLGILCLVKSIKDKLKKYYEEGLIWGLIGGLILGLIGGLILGLILGFIWGLIGGLILGLILGLIGGLILGLIGGLILGLILGLIGGLIWGLIKEFST